MKKYISILIALVLLSISLTVTAENDQYTIGAYYQLGKYNDKPIIWRCVSTNDENGILMVSDKILCFKAANAGKNAEELDKHQYGNNFWEESTIRTWLNSTAMNGNIEWTYNCPEYNNLYSKASGYDVNFPYASEKGFLCKDNFTQNEKMALKTVSQWQALPTTKLSLATNGDNRPYIWFFSTITGDMGESKLLGSTKLTELKDSYKGAMYRITDTIFLLNEPQLYEVLEQLGTVGTKIRESYNIDVGYISGLSYIKHENYYNYWLRSPSWVNDKRFNAVYMDKETVTVDSIAELGIRPGFYLNESTAKIKSGSGTEADPYILDGTPQEGITVFINGKQLDFDQQPLIENDHTLVGMRAVFESLGADVVWNGEDKTVTAVKDDTTIQLQIDNNKMQVNNDTVELETPARLINDNAMVPIRAVSEALDARVEWVDDLQRVVVDEQPEWVESDWNPTWYQQAMKVGGYIK